MAEKSADTWTLAPRLSYLEDQAQWLMENRGSGSGTLDTKLWRVTVEGAELSGSWSDEPWTQTDLIYGPDSINKMSLHQTLFATNPANALKCQDGKGLFGWIFPDDETRWQSGTAQGGDKTLATEIFGHTGNGFVESLRAASQSLSKAIWGDPTFIGTSDTIIGRIQQVADNLEELASNAESEISVLNNEIARLDARIDALAASM